MTNLSPTNFQLANLAYLSKLAERNTPNSQLQNFTNLSKLAERNTPNSQLQNFTNFTNLSKLAEINTPSSQLPNFTNLSKLAETHKPNTPNFRLAEEIIPILAREKIEVFELYTIYSKLMSSIEDKLKNNKINIPFNNLNFSEVLTTSEKQKVTILYEQIKYNIKMEIMSYIKVTLNQLLEKLDISEQLVTIVKLYLTEPELEPILCEIIENSKREVFDLLSEILSYKIIPDFYNQSYHQQKIALEGFNLIEAIVYNKNEILDVLTSITFDLPDEINQIKQYQTEMSSVSENKFSDKIIVNYMLPIISGKSNNEKIQTLIGINLNTHDSTGIKYVNSLLDNEIIFTCPE